VIPLASGPELQLYITSLNCSHRPSGSVASYFNCSVLAVVHSRLHLSFFDNE
jgi:hypothetical protein